jgi:hypothetical protein
MNDKFVKVKQSKDFQYYRLAVFGKDMDIKTYRDLQAGKEVEVSESLYKKYPNVFEVKEKPPKKKEEVE